MKRLIITLIGSIIYLSAVAQEAMKPAFEIYGQVMTDIGYNFGQVYPLYFDVMRPTQLPAYKNEYGTDGNTYFSVRQSSLGFKSYTDTKFGELKTRFDFDLFGVGPNAGQTTFHMLYAWIEIGRFGVGHNWSLFCDFDGFPNTVEYWGPSGMSLCKNVQFRYIPFQGENRLSFAIERPGASADEGLYRNRIELTDVKPKFNVPDFSAEFRMSRSWGYAELAGIVRKIEWVDQGYQPYDLSGKAVGWGFNLSTKLKLGARDIFKGQAIYGEGIQNYMNDAPTDIGIQNDFSNTNTPIKGVALPVSSFSAYLDHKWSEMLSTSIGYSLVNITNSDGQAADAFRKGQYSSLNLLYYPFQNMMAGAEIIWIKRDNYSDGWSSSATKIQFSFRYNFMQRFYRK
jgi:hypothetical protein